MSIKMGKAQIVEKDGLDKWNFDKETMNGILNIKYSINEFNNSKYERLFTIALASIFLEITNVYRNGKYISFKKKWKEQHVSQQVVHEKFLSKLEEVFLPDIKIINKYKKIQNLLVTVKTAI